MLLLPFILGKDWMHAAALVSLVWAIQLKTASKGGKCHRREVISWYLRGRSPKWLQHGTAEPLNITSL